MSKAKKSAKKEFRTKIAAQLTATFADLKERISAKKFDRKIREATRVLSQGIKTKNTDPAKDIKLPKHQKKVKLAAGQ